MSIQCISYCSYVFDDEVNIDTRESYTKNLCIYLFIKKRICFSLILLKLKKKSLDPF